MKNLLAGLREVGLSDHEAKKSIEVVYEWVEQRYPVLAAVARSTVTKEITDFTDQTNLANYSPDFGDQTRSFTTDYAD